MADPETYPPISDYALISDCHSAALVSWEGSIDWCCMPRMDAGSCFGRLLDWEKGGYCSIRPEEEDTVSHRTYLDDTLVLDTTFKISGGELRVLDCFTMREGGARNPYYQLLRVVEGIRGHARLRLRIEPRFDYGKIRPWLRHEGIRLYGAIGGNDALLVSGEGDLAPVEGHALESVFDVRAEERARFSLVFVRPEILDHYPPEAPDSRELDLTISWWQRWSSKARLEGPDAPGAMRSAARL